MKVRECLRKRPCEESKGAVVCSVAMRAKEMWSSSVVCSKVLSVESSMVTKSGESRPRGRWRLVLRRKHDERGAMVSRLRSGSRRRSCGDGEGGGVFDFAMRVKEKRSATLRRGQRRCGLRLCDEDKGDEVCDFTTRATERRLFEVRKSVDPGQDGDGDPSCDVGDHGDQKADVVEQGDVV